MMVWSVSQLDASIPHGQCSGGTGPNILHPPGGRGGGKGGQDRGSHFSEQGLG